MKYEYSLLFYSLATGFAKKKEKKENLNRDTRAVGSKISHVTVCMYFEVAKTLNFVDAFRVVHG